MACVQKRAHVRKGRDACRCVLDEGARARITLPSPSSWFVFASNASRVFPPSSSLLHNGNCSYERISLDSESTGGDAAVWLRKRERLWCFAQAKSASFGIDRGELAFQRQSPIDGVESFVRLNTAARYLHSLPRLTLVYSPLVTLFFVRFLARPPFLLRHSLRLSHNK